MAASIPAKKSTRQGMRWTQDPEGVRRAILEAAGHVFADRGFSGARVDDIAARAVIAKRMIYYYFTDKEGLYIAVLEAAYARIRQAEAALDLAALAPRAALAALAAFSFDHHAANPAFVRLVMVENIHHAAHLRKSGRIAALNHSALDMIGDIYRRGVSGGDFRPGLDPMDIHLTISALSFYNISNQASIREVFGCDMADPERRALRRASVVDLVLRFVGSAG